MNASMSVNALSLIAADGSSFGMPKVTPIYRARIAAICSLLILMADPARPVLSCL